MTDASEEALYALRVRVLGTRLKSALLAVRSHEQVTAARRLIAEQQRRPRWRRLRLVRPRPA